MYNLLVAKRKLESFIMFPFILLGRLWASFEKNKDDFEIYFFFPFYHVGGAEKVHYQIAQSFSGKKCIVYFTRKSKGENFLEEFKKAGFTLKDISRFTDNKFIYPVNLIFRGLISYKINRQKSPTLVFNGQSNFGYKISPWISKQVPQIDLIHALCSFSKIRIPFLEFYATSVTVSKEIIDKHRALYEGLKLPAKIISRITYVNYGIDLPGRIEKDNAQKNLKLLYVGRGSEEKRINLIARIAKAVHDDGRVFQFGFVGNVNGYIQNDLKKHCKLYGTVTAEKEIDKLYREHNVLLVTSYTESGPLVVMEAMARGLCIVSTPVGIVNEHVKTGKNGYVFSSIGNEDLIIREAVEYIKMLSANLDLQETTAHQNIDYAYANFGIEKFQQNYRQLFSTINPSR